MFNRKTLGIVFVAVSAAVAAPGCGAGDVDSGAEIVGEVGEAVCSTYPASCAAINNCDATKPDGVYTLYYGGVSTQPWNAWCAGMASGSPVSYLPLSSTDSASNFAQDTETSPVGNVKTSYTKLRINHSTLVVDSSDQTFATSVTTGTAPRVGSVTVTSMPFGVSLSCSSTSNANVDLRGLPFAMSTGSFVSGGTSLQGVGQTYSNDNQTVAITGGGACGWMQPSPGYPGGGNPINANGGKYLTLSYQASCSDGLQNGDETNVDCGGSCGTHSANFYDDSCDKTTLAFSNFSQTVTVTNRGTIDKIWAGIGSWSASSVYSVTLSTASQSAAYSSLTFSARNLQGYNPCVPMNNMAGATLPTSFYVSAGDALTITVTGTGGDIHKDAFGRVRLNLQGSACGPS